jgi:anaerobic selenocysteine-containing dehydrogenase
MVATIVIGAIFLGYFAWAFNSSRKSITSNKCSGCSGGCSMEQKNNCASPPQVKDGEMKSSL